MPPSNEPLSTSGTDGKKPGEGALHSKQDQAGNQPRPQNVKNNQTRTGKNPVRLEARSHLEYPTDAAIANCSDKFHREEFPLGGSSQKEAPGSSEANLIMTKLTSSPGFNHDRPSLEYQKASKKLAYIQSKVQLRMPGSKQSPGKLLSYKH